MKYIELTGDVDEAKIAISLSKIDFVTVIDNRTAIYIGSVGTYVKESYEEVLRLIRKKRWSIFPLIEIVFKK